MKRLPGFPLLASFVMSLFLAGCGSDPGAPGTPVPVAAAPDIYVAGIELNGTLYKAVYWKNGVITHLDSGPYGARATGIAAANGHVYVTGYVGSAIAGYNQATLWTDGVATTLAANNLNSYATSVTVSGQDVYVGGCQSTIVGLAPYSNIAGYWLNGVLVPLVTNTTGGCVEAVTASGSDLYALGGITGHTLIGPNSYGNFSIVTVWKNFVAQQLTDGTLPSTSGGFAIANGHVYVAGSVCATFAPDCNVAAYWVDGAVNLIPSSTVSEASGIAVTGSTISTSLNLLPSSLTGNLAEMSTGNTVVPLASDNQSGTYGIASYNGDVYVVGYDFYGACFWKNRTQTYLTGALGGTGSNIAVAIAVVPAT